MLRFLLFVFLFSVSRVLTRSLLIYVCFWLMKEWWRGLSFLCSYFLDLDQQHRWYILIYIETRSRNYVFSLHLVQNLSPHISVHKYRKVLWDDCTWGKLRCSWQLMAKPRCPPWSNPRWLSIKTKTSCKHYKKGFVVLPEGEINQSGTGFWVKIELRVSVPTLHQSSKQVSKVDRLLDIKTFVYIRVHREGKIKKQRKQWKKTHKPKI